jgi:hypothetical protein
MKIISIDFDGTCVSYNPAKYPDIGEDIGAVPVLKRLVRHNNFLILNTMRTTEAELIPALNWFEENNIPLFGVNENPQQKEWSKARKVYANLYIDDYNLGTPLILDKTISEKPFVDWDAVEDLLEEQGYF